MRNELQQLQNTITLTSLLEINPIILTLLLLLFSEINGSDEPTARSTRAGFTYSTKVV